MLVAIAFTWPADAAKGRKMNWWWILPALLVLLFWRETKPGRYGRPLMDRESGEPYRLYSRGSYDWYVYPEGRMLREARGASIEDTLPVEMQLKDQERLPALSLIFVIDTSGSMGAPGSQSVYRRGC